MHLSLPRSVVAATWIAHSDPRGDWLAPAVEAISGDDEPHRTTGSEPLAALLSRFAAAHVRSPVLAPLPVPHDPAGIGGPAGIAAVDAGECLVCPAALVAVPEVLAFGSALEPGAIVTWEVFEQPSNPPLATPADGRRMVAEALVVAVDALESVDVARWRPEAAEDIAALATNEVPASIEAVLPGQLDRRRRELLGRAARLEAIADLALADDGAAVNVWQADQRGAALRHVVTAARTAMVAASTFGPRES
ncbi:MULTISPECIES: hypothetical protein [unclassified Pseudactinotalea]|uniref:hypothetical protein n=1 Tax=unclassified Pseudactinotalea TaxID=2649176 RepID=UPI00128BDA5C|nr:MULTISPECIES: hypothetical protein [unclassified Pseudactinotalea]MPV49854.1 hypothetical protein [Pseudactinotalea sp. HY160]QGH69122.1 hypothetical protein GCE65_06075 [Pseudactinotalea sp. HY158]